MGDSSKMRPPVSRGQPANGWAGRHHQHQPALFLPLFPAARKCLHCLPPISFTTYACTNGTVFWNVCNLLACPLPPQHTPKRFSPIRARLCAIPPMNPPARRWEAISELVAAVSIPVVGNGDVYEAQDALAMLRATGCAGEHSTPWHGVARRDGPGPVRAQRHAGCRRAAQHRHTQCV